MLFDILKSVNSKQIEISRDEIERDYPAFMVNRGLSYFMDTIMFANEMNMHAETPSYAQYLFYWHGLRKGKRFSKWHKKAKIENVDLIKEYYNYGDTKAEAALELLNDHQIEAIRERLYKGGKR